MVPSRSRKTARRLASAIERGPHRARHGLQLVGENGARIEHDAIVGDARDDGRVVCPTSWRDRKSTRLNSSHDQISYAVFCLKKKKILVQSITYTLVMRFNYIS